MDFEQFMRLFHGAVAAVENGEVAEVELEAESMDDDFPLEVEVVIRRQQWHLPQSEDDDT